MKKYRVILEQKSRGEVTVEADNKEDVEDEAFADLSLVESWSEEDIDIVEIIEIKDKKQ